MQAGLPNFVLRRDVNPDKKGNIRDYATINELICLSNMENLNAVFIDQGLLGQSNAGRIVSLCF